jgi:DNA-binding transcriptional LysR family regulator
MLEIRRLRLLRELATRGTVAATARACSLTPSAVSQQLAVLEREVGVALLVREGRRLRLTDAALLLVEHTERILADLEEAASGVAALAGAVRGTARLAAFPSAARALVPGAIAACRARHPDLRVLLHEYETAEAVDALKTRAIDLALVYEYSLLPALADPGIALRPLLREPLLCVAPAGFAAAGEPLPLGLLRDEHWIAPSSDTALRTVLERACALAGFTPELDYASDDYTVILALVQAGLGVSLIPRLALESQDVRLTVAPTAELTLHRRVLLATRAGSGRHPATATVSRALVEVASRMPDAEPGTR